ncbi:hypothetical protein AMAG_12676 [Allomyces macrogynus ATCC 38327]|uniref:Uncharacterized protein n=1 Tax=Allomyces macrogynus (strain ATCC 38327) TaxID=578462 RepID=A0A0L0T188_ALLM3|nr:hypothetical protein AMAG_12676 [Allomyces macrogynus ATCC 38327]|eukprot:KNE68501.1 hypothetical protein AMAG_12676 [Allomyces macrogynus ATCC 38327]
MASATIRRATLAHAPAIGALLQGSAADHVPADYFGWGPSTATQEIETSVIALVAEQAEPVAADQLQVDGYLALSARPPAHRFDANVLRDMRKAGWDAWVKQHFQADKLERINTLFLSRFAATRADTATLLPNFLRTVFSLSPQLAHIALILPTSTPLLDCFRAKIPRPAKKQDPRLLHVSPSHAADGPADGIELFEHVPSSGTVAPFALYVCRRATVLPPLTVRRARVEDCDDLVPLFKVQNMLPPDAGDYHVAEILESRNPAVVSLVAEHEGTAVGFVSASTDVDVGVLGKYFALDLYTDLLNASVTDIETTPLAHVASVHASAQHLASERAGDAVDDAGASSAADVPTTGTSQTAQASTVPDYAQRVKDAACPAVNDEHNAFAIHLFCIDDRYMHQSTELIKPLFDAMPARDYCLLTQPSTCAEIPLLVASGGGGRFTRVPSVPTKQPAHVLYMAHRFGHQEKVSVRRGTAKDVPDVLNLLQSNAWEEKLRACDAEFEPCRAEGRSFFVVEAYQQLVGVALLKHAPIDQYVRDFDVERWVEPRLHDLALKLNECEMLAMNPLFECHARWVLQDIMNLAETSVLVYPCVSPMDFMSLKILRAEMVPMRPRRILDPKCTHPLLLMCNSIVYDPRVANNARYVFVGASDCNLSCIEELIFDDQTCYTNLTLISTEGISVRPELELSRALVRPHCVGFPLHINIIRNTVQAIVRGDKRVRLRRGGSVAYDQLVLAPGRAFTAPSAGDTDASVAHVPNMIPFDAAHLGTVLAAKERAPRGVVVHGANAAAFHCVSVLLGAGYPAANITHVAGAPTAWPAPLTARAGLVRARYATSGVRLVESLDATAMKTALDRVTGVRIGGSGVPCDLLVLAHEKKVTTMNFRMVHDASLVFDNGIVIGGEFGTCDPAILAAGTATRFSRKEGIAWTLADVNSREVGQRVAHVLRGMPEYDSPPFPLHAYNAAIVETATVASSLYYLSMTPPTPFRNTIGVGDWRTLATHRDGAFVSHVDVHIDSRGRIVEMKYVGDRGLSVDRAVTIYGVNERYLGRLADRFDDGLVEELFDYLLLPQFQAVFHDRFRAAMAHMRMSALQGRAEDGDWAQDLLEMAHAGANPSKEERKTVLSKFERAGDAALAKRAARDLRAFLASAAP